MFKKFMIFAICALLLTWHVSYAIEYEPAKPYNRHDLIIGENAGEYKADYFSKKDIVLRKNQYQKYPQDKLTEQYTHASYNKYPQETHVIAKEIKSYNKYPQDTTPLQDKLTNYRNMQKIYPQTKSPDVIISGKMYLIKSDWITIDGFFKENWKDVAKSYDSVCTKIKRQNDDKIVASNAISIGSIKNLKQICTEFLKFRFFTDTEARMYIMENFIPYLIGDDEKHTNAGLFTGYYYPVVRASRTRTSKYKYPIYKRPPELQTDKPYYTRQQINEGAISKRDLELFWLDDFVDLYYLQIQGSGMIQLPDGTIEHIKFSSKNGHQYTSIGKYMIQKGFIKNGSECKEFLRNNESLAQEILAINESYIFFETNYNRNVVGAHGSELIDMRSLAVDNDFIPYGSLLYVNTTNHDGAVFAQDTGSAIKGVIRGDIFVGKGYESGQRANIVTDKGFKYIIIHKDQVIKAKQPNRKE